MPVDQYTVPESPDSGGSGRMFRFCKKLTVSRTKKRAEHRIDPAFRSGKSGKSVPRNQTERGA